VFTFIVDVVILSVCVYMHKPVSQVLASENCCKDGSAAFVSSLVVDTESWGVSRILEGGLSAWSIGTEVLSYRKRIS